MVNLPLDANIQTGDAIISSGLGGIFPKGLVIGHVVEVEKDQYGLLQQALVAPAVNFNRLEEVFIVIDYSREAINEIDEADNVEMDNNKAEDEGEIVSET